VQGDGQDHQTEDVAEHPEGAHGHGQHRRVEVPGERGDLVDAVARGQETVAV
jgi:hypothetical protein